MPTVGSNYSSVQLSNELIAVVRRIMKDYEPGREAFVWRSQYANVAAMKAALTDAASVTDPIAQTLWDVIGDLEASRLGYEASGNVKLFNGIGS